MTTKMTADSQHGLGASMLGVGIEVPADPNMAHVIAVTDDALESLELMYARWKSLRQETDQPVTEPVAHIQLGGTATDIARSNVGYALPIERTNLQELGE